MHKPETQSMNINRLLFIILFFAVSHDAFALRCGTHLIREGDSFSRVEKFCGEPESSQTRSIYRTVSIGWKNKYISPQRSERSSERIQDTVTVEVIVDEWFYNFGPRKLSQKVIFEDGKVARIKNEGRGY